MPPTSGLPDAELLRAAWFASSLAQPEDVVVLAGDFNVTGRALADAARPDRRPSGASRSPAPASTTFSFAARRARRCAAGPTQQRAHDDRLLSDHAPVELDIG